MHPFFPKESGKALALTQTRKYILGRKPKKVSEELVVLVLVFTEPEKEKRKLTVRKENLLLLKGFFPVCVISGFLSHLKILSWPPEKSAKCCPEVMLHWTIKAGTHHNRESGSLAPWGRSTVISL